jgi:hypothetical protein
MELRISGHQGIGVQDTRVSGHQVKKEKHWDWYPGTLISVPSGGQALLGHLIP